MITYLFIGMMTMWLIEYGSPYPWTMFERVCITLLWPIAVLIMIHALIKRFTDDRD